MKKTENDEKSQMFEENSNFLENGNEMFHIQTKKGENLKKGEHTFLIRFHQIDWRRFPLHFLSAATTHHGYDDDGPNNEFLITMMKPRKIITKNIRFYKLSPQGGKSSHTHKETKINDDSRR